MSVMQTHDKVIWTDLRDPGQMWIRIIITLSPCLSFGPNFFYLLLSLYLCMSVIEFAAGTYRSTFTELQMVLIRIVDGKIQSKRNQINAKPKKHKHGKYARCP